MRTGPILSPGSGKGAVGAQLFAALERAEKLESAPEVTRETALYKLADQGKLCHRASGRRIVEGRLARSSEASPMVKMLGERGLLSEDQRAWLMTGDVPLVSPTTPVGEGPIASSTNTGLNMQGLKIGRSILVRLADGSVLKVKGAGWADRGLDDDKKVRALLPRHLPFAPIDSATNTWSQLFFGQTMKFALTELNKGRHVVECLALCAPEVLESAVRPVQAHVVQQIPLGDGTLVPYVAALADPSYYVGDEEQAKYLQMMARIRGRLPKELCRTITSFSLEQKRELLEKGFTGWPTLGGVEVPSPPLKADYPRAIVAQGLADRYSENEYLDHLLLTAIYFSEVGLPAVSIEHEPSDFRNSKLDWVLRPHEALLAEGQLSPTLEEQAARALRDIGALYRLAGVSMPAVVPSLAVDPRGHLDGAALTREVFVASKGRAIDVLQIEADKLASELAAMLAGGISFVDHHLMRKDFIGGIVTDYSDLRLGGADAADIGMALVQGRSQIDAMGKVLGLPRSKLDDFKTQFREALLDRLRSSILALVKNPPPGFDALDLGQQLEQWARAMRSETSPAGKKTHSTPHNQRLYGEHAEEGRRMLAELAPLLEDEQIMGLRRRARAWCTDASGSF